MLSCIVLLTFTKDYSIINMEGFIMIKSNKIRCRHCGDIIESRAVHDFVSCSCGRVAVDGGHDYLRRCGAKSDFDDLSEVDPDEEV